MKLNKKYNILSGALIVFSFIAVPFFLPHFICLVNVSTVSLDNVLDYSARVRNSSIVMVLSPVSLAVSL